MARCAKSRPVSRGRGAGVGGGAWRAARRVFLFALSVCAVSVAASSTSSAQYQFQVPTQRCFGAAARDLLAPCVNPKLAFTVVPSPSEALITPSPGCLNAQFISLLNVCQFGDLAAGAATSQIALVGDSHAWHWKPAVEVLARGERASGVSITRTSCPFSVSSASSSGPGAAQCVQWNQLLLRWFAAHPAVSTVFVSAHSVGPPRTPRQQAALASMIAGNIAAWRALPATVKHIVVIRDTPLNRFD
ncbi:MAG TPA: SGNH hydrolase domain-containing protein, partial [Solirubrobacteraceae bacterium]|nr:SGNH hydrolase domain-containing protein [Solirubrobacteraceae bacterium]